MRRKHLETIAKAANGFGMKKEIEVIDNTSYVKTWYYYIYYHLDKCRYVLFIFKEDELSVKEYYDTLKEAIDTIQKYLV